MELAALQAENLRLKIENEDLKNKQKAFQDALMSEVKRIQATPKAWRFLQYGKLLGELISTVLVCVETANK